ncbi:DNA polymerase epsilon subunit 4 [Galleria mellonella]|uniref:DNA polymerase epsilon subunit 4 n=1 Tax=Galleria mellonella TaxID=7137 RepID=A0A6J1WKN7_GALME|nr:DNA polymerase epsilon subunit 4 [Galleria mellonella]
MTEEHYTDVDISDIIDDTETDQFLDSHPQNTETSDILNSIQDSELLNSEDQEPEKKPQNKSEVIRSTRLPMARVKNIMKMDPDVSIVSSDAVFLVTKATELFLETIAKETYSYTSTNKRKLISKKDLDLIINKVDCLCFLEGAMDF